MSNDYHSSTAQGASKQQNEFMEKMLRSPQHSRVSGRILLLGFKGRKTGKPYAVPVSYMQEGGTVVCFTDSPWWRNLEGGAPVTLVLRGEDVEAYARATKDPAEVAAGLRRLALKDSDDAKYFGVTVDAEGQPDEAHLARAASENVMIVISLPLDSEAPGQ